MKRTKYIKPIMEFNPGLKKYEPSLPLKKSNKKIEFNWIKFILILFGIIVLTILAYIFLM